MLCSHDKDRENAAALAVLPDLLQELDAMSARERLTSLIEGVLAANIFDWGARATVELYQNGTILEIYRYCRLDDVLTSCIPLDPLLKTSATAFPGPLMRSVHAVPIGKCASQHPSSRR